MYRVTLVNISFSVTINTSAGVRYATLDQNNRNIDVPNEDVPSIASSLNALAAGGMVAFQYLSDISDVKEMVKVGTTAPITLSDLQSIDSIPLYTGDRVLVKDQGSPIENGIYHVISGSNWLRSSDFNAGHKFRKGTQVPIGSGSTLTDTLWMVSSEDPHVVGTSNITFVRVSEV